MLSLAAMSAIPTQEIPDERLVRALTAGEAAAFDELYRRYARRLAAYGARLLGDASAGEDVAQIALLNAYQALRRGTEPAQVRAWLFRIAHNAALEILSRRRELVEFNEEHHRCEDLQEASAARGALLAALGALPERQRAAYLLREVRGLRMSEIGERLDLSQQQVEQALFAARNRLAEQLTFGDGLDCETALDLGSKSPHRATQRALKRHLRACVSCRAASRSRTRRIGLLGPLGVLRDVAAWLAGASAAPAAKLGAVAAAAAVAVGTPALGGSTPGEAVPPRSPGPSTLPTRGVDAPTRASTPLRVVKPRPRARPARVVRPVSAPITPVPAPPAQPTSPEIPARPPTEQQAPPAEDSVPSVDEEVGQAEVVDEVTLAPEEEPNAEEEQPAPAEEQPVDAYTEEPEAVDEAPADEAGDAEKTPAEESLEASETPITVMQVGAKPTSAQPAQTNAPEGSESAHTEEPSAAADDVTLARD
jgi:RNA polymerase sigma factor (sigma-70 family)